MTPAREEGKSIQTERKGSSHHLVISSVLLHMVLRLPSPCNANVSSEFRDMNLICILQLPSVRGLYVQSDTNLT